MTMSADEILALYHCTVIDSSGQQVGDVGQVFLDQQTDEPAWVTMKTGLFGTHQNFVPLQGAQITADKIHVPFSKDFITAAPKVDAEEDFDDSNGVENLYRYYQLDAADPSGTESGPAPTSTAVTAIRRHQPS
ncbi:MAG: PRC-barrel domain-containing protein [Nakamurella sp.]